MGFESIKVSPEKMRRVLKAARMNRSMLARKLNIATETARRYARGTEPVGVDPETFERMVAVLNVRPEDLEANGEPASQRDHAKLEIARLMADYGITFGEVKKTAASQSPAARAKAEQKNKPR